MRRTTDEKVNTVIKHNTFWYKNNTFEENNEAHITALKETMLVLKNQVQNEGLTKDLLDTFIAEKENGLKVLLALTGISKEQFKRLITFIRVVDDEELSRVSCRDMWIGEAELDETGITEWQDATILKKIQTCADFRRGVINLFYEGSTIPILAKTLPLFELKKMGVSKLTFGFETMIDTLVRYKEKGSYSGMKQNNAEVIIGNLLDEMEINFDQDVDLEKLKELTPNEKRTMDFIIPNRKEPQVIIESSYSKTTSSAQGDKAKTEIAIRNLLADHYPNAHFWGFVDGISWYVRKEDLRRMTEAFEDVFTLEESELLRFQESLIAVLK